MKNVVIFKKVCKMETHIIRGDEEMYVKIQIGEHNDFILEEAEGNVSYKSDKIRVSLECYRLLCGDTAITNENNKVAGDIEDEVCDFFGIKDDFDIEYAMAPEGNKDTAVELRHIFVNGVHYITPYKIYITNNRGQTYQAI